MKHYRLSTPIIVLMCSLVVFGMFGFARYLDPNRPFDRQVWLAHNGESSDNPRLNMEGDLRAHYLLVGMSRGQVTALLGEPNGASFVSETGVYFYMLGFQSIDPSFLCIEFDANDKVRRIWRFDS